MQYQPNQTCCGPNPVVNGWCYSECGQQLPIVPGSNQALNYWNGQNFIVADGSNTNPINLPYIKQASGSPQFLLGSDSQGNWAYYSGNQSNVATAIAGGSTGQIPIQTAPSTTSFVYPSLIAVGSFTTASGSAPSYGIRAWAFIADGTINATNAVPSAGGNLIYSHVAGTGVYTFTFLIPPSNANYCVQALSSDSQNSYVDHESQTQTSFSVHTFENNDTPSLSVLVVF